MKSLDPIELCIKNRSIRLPDTYPAKAGSRLFLTTSLTGCLMLFPVDEWLAIRNKLITCKQGKVFFTKRGLNKLWQIEIQNLIATGEDVEVTKDRRIEFSSYQARAAKMTDAMSWVPKEKYIELWNPRRYSELVELGVESWHHILSLIDKGVVNSPV